MRGVWVATTKNIDYPTSKYLGTAEQKREFIELLNLFEELGINAVFVQVRPAADAFFESPYEPWSEWLTGEQGKAPEPYYDPMAFMIEECKKRDIEFHAWINPFRAVANIETADIAENHISKRKPEWFFTYDINTYFNPGLPEVRDYIVKIIEDITLRYDVDGIHFDDYFYPYPKRNKSGSLMPLPDKNTFKKYGKGFSDIRDWRRDNMDKFIQAVYRAVKDADPTVKFGVGPSGVWRNKGSDPKGSDTRGLAHYDYLYADVLKWLKNDWIDYVAPQLYWHIGHSHADFKTLVKWWDKNCYGKHLYIGQGIYMAKKDASYSNWRNPNELPNQIRFLRKYKNVKGTIFYKASALRRNPLGFNDTLKSELFAEAAIPPKMDWNPLLVAVDIADIDHVETSVLVDFQAPPAPEKLYGIKAGKYYMLSWDIPHTSGKDFDDAPVKYNIYRFKGLFAGKISPDYKVRESKEPQILIRRKRFALFKKQYTYIVTAVDAAGNESTPGESFSLKIKLKGN